MRLAQEPITFRDDPVNRHRIDGGEKDLMVNTQTEAASRLLTVREVAERTRLSERSIRGKIASGVLPAVQIGGRYSAVRIDEQELNEYIYGESK